MTKMVGILDPGRITTDEAPRPSPKVIQGYQELPDLAGLVARSLDYFGIVGTIPSLYLKPIRSGARVVGSAVTVRNIPERETPYRQWKEGAPTRLGEREAFFLAQDGDVVVIDGSAVLPASCLGSMSVRVASQLGVAGVVVYGAVTGVAGIRAGSIPVWALGGTTITGHHRVETIEINGPIGIHGVRVDPGDIIVADDSGVTVVPLDLAETVLERARDMKQLGVGIREMLERSADREALRSEVGNFMQKLTQRPDNSLR
jgi:regulator of RNase E activity RraA